jgi:hypothetical protein
MRKTSYWLFIVLSALIFISCGKDEPDLSSINPGLYEINHDIKYAGQLIILKQRVRYNADGTYEATNLQNNAVVEELRGKYRVENSQLVSYDTQRRLIIQEGTWTPKKEDSRVDLRRIKKGSYQYFFKYPDERMREKYKGLGLSEGWKTYKRISD